MIANRVPSTLDVDGVMSGVDGLDAEHAEAVRSVVERLARSAERRRGRLESMDIDAPVLETPETADDPVTVAALAELS